MFLVNLPNTLKKYFGLLILILPLFIQAQQLKISEGYINTEDGTRLYYRVYGNIGDTVVFLHGGPGGNLETPMEVLLQLATKHVVVAYDQRGGGQSTVKDSSSITLQKHVDDLETIREAFNINTMSIFGYSWGGTLALYYVYQYPEHVTRMILYGPMPPAKEPFDKERSENYEKALTLLCRQRAEAAKVPDIDAYIAECKKSRNISWRVQYKDTGNLKLDIGRASREVSGIPGVNRFAFNKTMQSLGNWDFRPIMPNIKTPTLIVNGEQAFPPVEHLYIWGRNLSNAKVLLIPNSGHETAQFENPAYFYKSIEMFLNGKWPQGAKSYK